MERNNSGHVNQRLTRQTFVFVVSSTNLAHAQSMNIAKKDLLEIKVDFLARAFECMLCAIATTQSTSLEIGSS